MAFIQDGRAPANSVAVEAKTKAMRVVDCPRGLGLAISGTSGTIAAAQAAGGCYFSMRSNPSAGTVLVFLERFRLQYTTLASYTTSVVAGRRLGLYRGSGAAPSGGTQLQPVNVDTTGATSQMNTSLGGDVRIATTATLSTTGITWEALPIREMSLTHLGVAGYQGNEEQLFDFAMSSPIVLQPGQVLGIRNVQAMDAAGTWQISCDLAAHESQPWASANPD